MKKKMFSMGSLLVLICLISIFLYSCKGKHIHQYGEEYGGTTIIVDPTCENDGQISKSCGCGDIKVEVIPALGHSMESQIINPTCTEKGYTIHNCSECGYVIKDNYVSAVGHDEVVIPGNPADCTHIGYTDASRCSVCDEVLSNHQKLSATGHNVIYSRIIEPTCCRNGYDMGVCSECGVEVSRIVPATDHTPSELIYDEYDTCDGHNVGYTYCLECEEILTTVGHTYETNVVQATCLENGYIEYSCSKCDDYYKIEKSATGHIESSWEVVLEATCKNVGKEEKHCIICNEVTASRDIDVINHIYSQSINGNVIRYDCISCDSSYEEILDENKNYYTITFISNSTNEVPSLCVMEGDSVLLPIPQKTGCEFLGWYLDEELSSIYTNFEITSDLILYARWTEKIVYEEQTDLMDVITTDADTSFIFEIESIDEITNENISDYVKVLDASDNEKALCVEDKGNGVYIISSFEYEAGEVYTAEIIGVAEFVGAPEEEKILFITTDENHEDIDYKDEVKFVDSSEIYSLLQSEDGESFYIMTYSDIYNAGDNSVIYTDSTDDVETVFSVVSEDIKDGYYYYEVKVPEFDDIFTELDFYYDGTLNVDSVEFYENLEEEISTMFYSSPLYSQLSLAAVEYAKDMKYEFENVKLDIKFNASGSQIIFNINAIVNFKLIEDDIANSSFSIVLNFNNTIDFAATAKVKSFKNFSFVLETNYTSKFELFAKANLDVEADDEINKFKEYLLLQKQAGGFVEVGEDHSYFKQDVPIASLCVPIGGAFTIGLDITNQFDFSAVGQIGIETLVKNSTKVGLQQKPGQSIQVISDRKVYASASLYLMGKITFSTSLNIEASFGILGIINATAGFEIKPHFEMGGVLSLTIQSTGEFNYSMDGYISVGVKLNVKVGVNISITIRFFTKKYPINILDKEWVIFSTDFIIWEIGNKVVPLYFKTTDEVFNLNISCIGDINLNSFVDKTVVMQDLVELSKTEEEGALSYYLTNNVSGVNVSKDGILSIVDKSLEDVSLNLRVYNDNVYKDVIVNVDINHNIHYDSYLEPTCTSEGRLEAEYCQDCNFVFSGQRGVIEKLEHSLISEVSGRVLKAEANCIHPYQYYYSCEHCSYISNEYFEYGNITDHTYDSDLTCIDRDCKVCDHIEYATTEHNYTDWVTVEEDTCVTESYQMRCCRDCLYFETDIEEGSTIHPHEYEYVEMEATCTESITYYRIVCANCGIGREEITKEALGHDCTYISNEDGHYQVCTREGCDYSTKLEEHISNNAVLCEDDEKCIECGYVINAIHDHDYIIKSYLKPTCEENGHTEHRQCLTCEKTIGYYELEAIGHNYYCSSNYDGTHSTICRNCDDEIIDDCIFEKQTIDATCTEDGYVEHKCIVCNYTYRDIIETSGHLLAITIISEPTCSSLGEHRHACLNCSYYETHYIPLLEHNYEQKIIKEASCLEDGYYYNVCVDCGAFEDGSKVIIAKLEHSFEECIIKAASCHSEGLKHNVCSHCNTIEENSLESIPLKDHSYIREVIVEPTCYSEGLAQYECSVCLYVNESLNEIIDKLNHTYSLIWHNDETNHWHECNICGEVLDKEIHIPGNEATETSAQLCTVCSYVINPELDHTHSNLEYVEAREATCISSGNIEYYLCGCHKMFSDVDCLNELSYSDVIIAALGHDEAIINKEATCTENGYINRVICNRCDCVIKNGTIVYGGCVYEEVSRVEATCLVDGIIYYECINCDNTMTEAIHHHSHAYYPQVDKTCTTDGYKEHYYCNICDVYYDLEYNDVNYDDLIIHNCHTTVYVDDIAPTCISKGNIEYWICVDCKQRFEDANASEILYSISLDCLGHDLSDEYFYDTSHQNHYVQCNRCDYKEYGLCTYEVEIITEATCEEDGHKEYYHCLRDDCQLLYLDEACKQQTNSEYVIISATGHSHTYTHINDSLMHAKECVNGCDYYEELECDIDHNTCKHQVCSLCDHEYSELVDHSYPDIPNETQQSTCQVNGYDLYICELCGKEHKVDYAIAEHESSEIWNYDNSTHYHLCKYGCGTKLDILEHYLCEWIIDEDSTCTEEGTECRECDCGYKETRSINKKDHEYGKVQLEKETYEEDGIVYYIYTIYEECLTCGDINIIGITEKSYHDNPVVVEREEATCLEDGHEPYIVCGVEGCEKVLSKEITIIPALGHEYVSGKCSRCGCLSYSYDLTYELIDGSYYVTGKTNTELDYIIIPDTYNDIPVVGVKTYAFEQIDFDYIYFGANIIDIETYSIHSMYGRPSIIEVSDLNTKYKVLENSLVDVTTNTLILASSNSTTIPDCVTILDVSSFACTNITTIDLNNVVIIKDRAFLCTNLESITIKNTVLEMEGNIFFLCNYLQYVVIEKGIETIGATLFEHCDNLISVTYLGTQADFDMISIDSDNDILFDKLIILGEEEKTLEYELRDNGYYVIGIGSYEDTDLVIPSTYLNEAVVGIAANAFNGVKLTSVSIPESVIDIEDKAFYSTDRYDLESISIDDNNTIYSSNDSNCIIEISSNILIFGCNNTSIPTSVVAISDYAFAYSGIEYVYFASNLSSIGQHAFAYSSIKEVNLLYAVTVGYRAFRECDQMNTVYICGDVILNNDVFRNSDSLEKVEFEEGFMEIPKNSFYYCRNLYDITLPSTITTIGEFAFGYNSRLYEIEIPANAVIQKQAFLNCSNIVKLTINEGVCSENNSFANCYKIYELYNLSKGTFFHTTLINVSIKNTYYSAETESSIVKQDDYLFYNDSLIAYIGKTNIAITLPTSYNDSVYTLGDYFLYLRGVESVTISEGVTTIPYYGLYGSGIVSISLPNSLTVIKEYAFGSLENLNEITIPSNVINIYDNAFSGTYRLFDIFNESALDIESGSDKHGMIALYAKNVYNTYEETNHPTYEDENGYKFIEIDGLYYLYGYDTSLTNIVLPDDINGNSYIIMNHTFNRTSIRTITISSGVIGIEAYAFTNITRATEFVMGENVEFIDSYAFNKLIGEITIEIPKNIKTLNSYVLEYCQIESLVLNNTLECIDSYALANFSGNITFNGTLEEWNTVVKNDNWRYNTGDFTVYCLDGEINYYSAIYEYDYNYNGYVVTGLDDLGIVMLTIADYYEGYPVVGIRENAFNCCSTIEVVYYLPNVVNWGNNAFYGCDNLQNIFVFNVSINEWISYNVDISVFENCYNLYSVILSDDILYYNQITYELSEDGTYYIATGYNYTDNMAVLEIPQYYHNKPVRAIADNAFKDMTDLYRLTISSEYITIGNNAFYACHGLIAVEIQSHVVSIGDYAFYACHSLESVNFYNNVDSIGDYTFGECHSLATIYTNYIEPDWYNIPKGENYLYDTYNVTIVFVDIEYGDVIYVYSEEYNAFVANAYSTDSTTITIENEFYGYPVVGISSGFYSGGLDVIHIPLSIEYIEANAFSNCTETIINYEGTVYDFSVLLKYGGWTDDTLEYVYCCDGSYSVKPETAINYLLSEDGTYYIVNGIGECDDYVDTIYILETYNNLPVLEIVSANYETEFFSNIVIPGSIEKIYAYAFRDYNSMISIICNFNSDILRNICEPYAIPENLTVNCEDGTYIPNNCDYFMFEQISDTEYVVSYINNFDENRLVIPYKYNDGYVVGLTENPVLENCDNIVSLYLHDKFTILPVLYNMSQLHDIYYYGTTLEFETNVGYTWYCGYQETVICTDDYINLRSFIDQLMYQYVSNEDGLYITGYGNMSQSDLYIFSYIYQDKVEGIYDSSFENCQYDRLYVANGITNINQAAFRGCSITEAYLPNTLEFIGEEAFANLSNSLTIYYNGSYEEWQSITREQDWVLGSEVTVYFSDNSFVELQEDDCAGIDFIYEYSEALGGYIVKSFVSTNSYATIPLLHNEYYIYAIADSAFESSDIVYITIDAEIQYIEAYAFAKCSNLETINYYGTVEQWNMITKKDNWNYNSVFNVVCSDGTISIDDCFTYLLSSDLQSYTLTSHNDTSIESIVIPAIYNELPVTAIAETVFYGYSSLTNVYFEEDSNIQMLGYESFAYCINLQSIIIPASVVVIYDFAFKGCTALNSVTFEEGCNLNTIASYAFAECSSLTTITIPESVEMIGQYAFLLSGLESIYFDYSSWQAIATVQANYYNVTFGDDGVINLEKILGDTYEDCIWMKN